MKCKDCGCDVGIRSTITRGCDNCLRIGMALRAAAIQNGWKPTRLARWAVKRSRELGIAPK
jgi:hypothetical protein